MRTMRNLGLMLAGIVLAELAIAQNAPPPDMKAREAFFFPKAKAQQVVDRGVTRPPAPAATAAPTVPAAPATTAVTTAQQRPGADTTLPPATAANTSASTAPVLVSSQPAASPLAFRYSLKRRVSGVRSDEVDTDTTFSQGDAIKVFVTLNDAGYLYVAQQGSSGTWSVLFPVAGENNAVSGYADIEIPRDSGSWMRFDATPGAEHLFIAASRRPIADLEQVLSAGQKPQSSPAAPAPRPAGTFEVAALTDSTMTKLRSTVLTRDLVIEKIDAGAGATEHAVYVATSSGSGNLVIADFKLQHRQ